MIESRAPCALEVGDHLLVWCPDWMLRRATLVEKQHLSATLSPKGARVAGVDQFEKVDLWRLTIRWIDGENAHTHEVTYRADYELVPVVVEDQAARARDARRLAEYLANATA